MSTSARVDSTDTIKDFRVHLAKFQESASLAIGDADSDIGRMSRWLEGEGLNFWLATVRKRQEQLVKAEEAFRFKRLYKDSSGSTPSAVEEQKAVSIAKKNLNDAQEKVANVKKWTRQLQKEEVLYRGNVSRFANTVSSQVPAAIAHLGATLDQLDKYLEVSAGPGVGEPTEGAPAGAVAREDAGPSMARAAEEAPKFQEDGGVDPLAIRAGAPSSQAVIAAKPAEKEPVHLACGRVTDGQLAPISALIGDSAAPSEGERIIISPSVMGSPRAYLLRVDTGGVKWCLGSVDGPDSGVYNTVTTGDLIAGRPDLVLLLKLPAGSLAIIDSKGLAAVYNVKNENVLPRTEPAGSGAA